VGLARQYRSEVERIDKQMDAALASLTTPLRAKKAAEAKPAKRRARQRRSFARRQADGARRRGSR
jgi:hypothetical protein